ncbi:UvrD-helicase domain-containing protein [bacterium]|nr:UvrD-helicase domain-containing protein [bacterium]
MNTVDKNLSAPQEKAVKTTEGAVLVFAGAGSGKTRVITHRIASLVNEKHVPPENILAVTFTNKAAKEMRARLNVMLDSDEKSGKLTICTFHALGLQILRSEYAKVGYPPSFTIYSPYEQSELMKIVMAEAKISTERFSPQALVSAISKMKNDPALREKTSFLVSNIANAVANRLFEPYCEAMKVRAAFDFDDLIGIPVSILKSDAEICRKYASRYRYIMVDEYQDTNSAQFEFVKLLSSVHKNLCVVGDDDQSIYSWRGADVGNILNFEHDFENVSVIKLEENYRSVHEIVDAAGKLIANNVKRSGKNCFASRRAAEGEGIRVVSKQNEKDEAEFVAQEISNWRSNGEKLNNIAVIVRANFQTKFFEVAFSQYRIPFVVIGGSRFFENKEIKDILAYIRVLLNPDDEINLRRIINYPARGIGNATVEKFFRTAESLKMSPGELLNDFNIYRTLFSPEQTASLNSFVNLFCELGKKFSAAGAMEFTSFLVETTGIEKEIKKSAESEEAARVKLDNISAFFDAVATDASLPDYKTARAFFARFVNNVSLLGSSEEESREGKVTIITAHSAKGLEFDRVFIPGFYQGGFPNHLAVEEYNIDEERRLAYVAFTRAKRVLVITIPETVSFRGNTRKTEKSVFVKEAGLDGEKYGGTPADPAEALRLMIEKLENDG